MSHQGRGFQAITWRGPEFLYRQKTPLWYTNVGVFFFLALLFFTLTHNWFSVGLTAFLFWFFISRAEERPRIVTYKIDDTGVTIDDRTIPYSTVQAFSLETHHNAPVISVELVQNLAFPVTLVLKKDMVDEVVDALMPRVPMSEETSLIRWLTHWLHY